MSTLSRVHVFTVGQVLTAAQLNNEFNNIVNDYNGSVNSSNIGTLTSTLTFTVSTNVDVLSLTKSGTGIGNVIDASDAGTDPMVSLTKTGVGKVLYIRHTQDAIGVDIDSDSTTADVFNLDIDTTTGLVFDINSDNLTTGKVFDITAPAMTSGVLLSCLDADALTTGGFLALTSNSSNTGTRNLVSIINDHASATGTTALYIQQDSTNFGMDLVGKARVSKEFQLGHISTPSNPASGYLSVLAKSDNNLYLLTSGGTETKVSTASDVAGNGFVNLGMTTGADSSQLKITSADHTALSSTNKHYIAIPHHSTPGKMVFLSGSADVTMDLTGLKFHLDTLGNMTDVPLIAYAINDTGTLKYGVAHRAGMRSIADTKTSTTQASVNTFDEMFVNSALNAGTWPCVEIGWFLVDFTDASDEYAIQTAAGEISVGVKAPVNTDALLYTPDVSNTTGVNVRKAWSSREGKNIRVRFFVSWSGGGAGAGFTVALPSGLLIDTSLLQTDSEDEIFGAAKWLDNGTAHRTGVVMYQTSTTIGVIVDNSNALVGTDFAAGDILSGEFVVPIVQWSAGGT